MIEMIPTVDDSPEEASRGSGAQGLSRAVLSEAIGRGLLAQEEELARQWGATAPINYFVLDDVLPVAWAEAIRSAFPHAATMGSRRNLREWKCFAAQMNKYHQLLEEAIYAFQAPTVVGAVERITGLNELEPDELLYAGGISLMAPRHFLNPHIDNSHDKFRRRYRILNLLYYVSPDWPDDRGGNLELWPNGVRGRPVTVVSSFNRLVVMITHRHSWHSVSRNLTKTDRCCVSNYFFSAKPLGGADYYHVTEFHGRPEQPLRNLALRADNWLRSVIRTRLPAAFKNPHFYDAPPTPESWTDRQGHD
jgi:Rps23 Pro-64 3,4-dihydroxylase Tpa1-like proline 4-hydroxylase